MRPDLGGHGSSGSSSFSSTLEARRTAGRVRYRPAAVRCQMNVVDQMLTNATALRRFLSDQDLLTIQAVAQWRLPFVKVTGLPVVPDQRTLAANASLGAIALLGARPVAYIQENSGQVVREVQPKAGKEEELSSHGSLPLPMHTDMTYLSFPGEMGHQPSTCAPDFLVLTCVANDPLVPTRLVSIQDLHVALSDDDFAVLSKPLFDIRTPDAVVPIQTVKNRPILYQGDLGWMMRYNAAYITASDPDAIAALNAVASFTSNPSTGANVVLVPGEMLIFNNRQLMHGRGEIPSSKDPLRGQAGDRFLMRVYGQRLDTPMGPTPDPIIQEAK